MEVSFPGENSGNVSSRFDPTFMTTMMYVLGVHYNLLLQDCNTLYRAEQHGGIRYKKMKMTSKKTRKRKSVKNLTSQSQKLDRLYSLLCLKMQKLITCLPGQHAYHRTSFHNMHWQYYIQICGQGPMHLQQKSKYLFKNVTSKISFFNNLQMGKKFIQD